MSAAKSWVQGAAFGWFLLLSGSVLAAPVPITLDEVTKRVLEADLTVLENAERVYQAKESVQLARRNLLPKLNLWSLLEVAVDPKGVVGVIEDVAPFLVPNNWFRVKEEKELLVAQEQAFRALRANEVLTARGLYLHAVLDVALLERLQSLKAGLEDVLELVRARAAVGGTRPGMAQEVESEVLALAEDERSLLAANREETTELGLMLGLGGAAELELTAPAMPEFSSMQPLSFSSLESVVLERAPERLQFQALIRVADKIKKERYFSFLGASSMSRGVGGGVFDELPAQEGLGFGLGPSIRITKSQKRILELQARGVDEVLRRGLKLAVDSFNSDLIAFGNLKRRAEIAGRVQESVWDRIHLGEEVEMEEVILATRNRVSAETAFTAVQFRLLSSLNRISRLRLEGSFQGL